MEAISRVLTKLKRRLALPDRSSVRPGRHRGAGILPIAYAAHHLFTDGFFMHRLSANGPRLVLCSRKLGVTTTTKHFEVLFLQVAELSLNLVKARPWTRLVPRKLLELVSNFFVLKFRTVPRKHLVNGIGDIA